MASTVAAAGFRPVTEALILGYQTANRLDSTRNVPPALLTAVSRGCDRIVMSMPYFEIPD
jgi:hypothetical protein